jgi:hypothetical protein
MLTWRMGVVVVLVAVAAGACGTAVSPPSGQPDVASRPPAATGPSASVVDPSESAKMVCAAEAQRDIAAATGVTPVRVDPPTWLDHNYACRYVYPDGSFSLSVKELASPEETDAYFAGLSTQLGNTRPLDGYGEAAFTTSNGSVVARKDWKVLLVDDAALPPRFGSPPASPPSMTLVIARTILGCWTGA